MQPTEHKEQTLFFNWCLKHQLEYAFVNMIFSIPNGANFDAIRGKLLKDEGLRAGIPDMFLPVPQGKFHGMFIEMKVRKGGNVSPKQKAWMNALTEQGYLCVVAKGFQEAREHVIRYYST